MLLDLKTLVGKMGLIPEIVSSVPDEYQKAL